MAEINETVDKSTADRPAGLRRGAKLIPGLRVSSPWACIVMAYIVMAYIVMAYIVMAYIVMAYIVMAYIVMA